MPPPDRPRGDVTGKLTVAAVAAVAAVVAAIACCGIPLLVAAGLLTTTGVALRNLALVGLGIGLAAWLVWRAARRARHRQDQDLGTVPPRSHQASGDGRGPEQE